MKKPFKWIIAVVIIAVIATAAVISAMQPVKVGAAAVTPSLWEESFTEKGEIVEKDPVRIYAKDGGLILSAFVRDGDGVEAGDTMFTFDATQFSLQLSKLKNDLKELEGREKQSKEDRGQTQSQIDAQIYSVQTQRATARSQIPPLEVEKGQQEKRLESLEKTLEDTRVLYELGEVAGSALDEALEAVEAQRSAVEAVLAQIASLYSQIDALNIQETNLRSARSADTSGEASAFAAQKATITQSIADTERKISDAVVRAPASGAVKLPAAEGETLPPGALLAEISVKEDLGLECYLLVDDLGSVSPGGAVEAVLRRRSGDIRMEARVTEIGKEAVDRISALGLTEKRVRVKLAMSEDDLSRLGLGYALDITFKTSRIENCIYVPKTAVFSTETGFAVWVIENGAAKSRTVERGPESAANVVITSGLSAGDVVVTDAEQYEIKEGMKLAAA